MTHESSGIARAALLGAAGVRLRILAAYALEQSVLTTRPLAEQFGQGWQFPWGVLSQHSMQLRRDCSLLARRVALSGLATPR